jgi:hypothetical protein
VAPHRKSPRATPDAGVPGRAGAGWTRRVASAGRGWLMPLMLAIGAPACGPSRGTAPEAVAQAACALPPPAASAAAPPVQFIELGTRRVGETVTFTVPSSAASITIVEQVVSATGTATFTNEGELPNTAVPLRILDPGGTVVFDSFSPPSDPARALFYFASSAPGVGTISAPGTTAGLSLVAGSGLPQGTWRVVVSDLAHLCTLAANCAPGGGSSSGRYDVTVLVKPGTAIPAHGQVDVTLYLVPGAITPSLSAATAATDADLQRMVRSLRALLAQAALALGTVSYVDVSGDAAARVAAGLHVGDGTVCSDLHQLLATAQAGRQVNVFLVPGFVSSDVSQGASIAGLDGAVPGPATFAPTLEGGVAVSAANLRAGRGNCGAALALDCAPDANGNVTCCGADLTAYVVAHELGHFFGLYHVTERDGATFEPLADTPTCPCRLCAPDPTKCADATPAPASPHGMGVLECEAGPTCGGGDNLMFWLIGKGSTGTLTPEQSSVIRANPAVY